MIVRKGVVRGGQVVVGEPINLPDGCEVTITVRAGTPFYGAEDNDRPPTPEGIAADLAAMAEVEPLDMTDAELVSWGIDRPAGSAREPDAGKVGLDESEWRDGPEAVAGWAAWLDTIEPVEFAPEGAFEEEFRRFNVEAVRKQMSGEGA